MVFHYLDSMAKLSSRPPGSKRRSFFKGQWIRRANGWSLTIKLKVFGYETKLQIRISIRLLNTVSQKM